MPTAWDQLTQEQLRHVIRLLWLYGECPDKDDRVITAAFVYFARIDIVKRLPGGWLCRRIDTGEKFVLAKELLPDIMATIEFVIHPEHISNRIERVGDYNAVDFKLRELMFGGYLQAENFYQAFLLSGKKNDLISLCRVLYDVPDEDDAEELKEEILLGAFLWFQSVKTILARWFPNFLKSAAEGESVCQESMFERTRAQIRILTKGDVTKQKYILEKTDTWTALAELDSTAKDSEEIKKTTKKHGK